MTATIASVGGAWPNRTAFLPIMYTPAVTIVAAWISADTGVGPSIASGSQTYRGICADFPVAPTNNRSAMAVSRPAAAVSGGNLDTAWNTGPKLREPKC